MNRLASVALFAATVMTTEVVADPIALDVGNRQFVFDDKPLVEFVRQRLDEPNHPFLLASPTGWDSARFQKFQEDMRELSPELLKFFAANTQFSFASLDDRRPVAVLGDPLFSPGAPIEEQFEAHSVSGKDALWLGCLDPSKEAVAAGKPMFQVNGEILEPEKIARIAFMPKFIVTADRPDDQTIEECARSGTRFVRFYLGTQGRWLLHNLNADMEGWQVRRLLLLGSMPENFVENIRQVGDLIFGEEVCQPYNETKEQLRERLITGNYQGTTILDGDVVPCQHVVPVENKTIDNAIEKATRFAAENFRPTFYEGGELGTSVQTCPGSQEYSRETRYLEYLHYSFFALLSCDRPEVRFLSIGRSMHEAVWSLCASDLELGWMLDRYEAMVNESKATQPHLELFLKDLLAANDIDRYAFLRVMGEVSRACRSSMPPPFNDFSASEMADDSGGPGEDLKVVDWQYASVVKRSLEEASRSEMPIIIAIAPGLWGRLCEQGPDEPCSTVAQLLEQRSLREIGPDEAFDIGPLRVQITQKSSERRWNIGRSARSIFLYVPLQDFHSTLVASVLGKIFRPKAEADVGYVAHFQFKARTLFDVSKAQKALSEW